MAFFSGGDWRSQLGPIANRPQLTKLSGMGLRPTEVHENPLDRRPTVDKVSNRIGDRYPPYTRVGFRPCPTKGQLHAVAVLVPEMPANRPHRGT